MLPPPQQQKPSTGSGPHDIQGTVGRTWLALPCRPGTSRWRKPTKRRVRRIRWNPRAATYREPQKMEKKQDWTDD